MQPFSPLFLSDKSREGFDTLRSDLQKLRQKNREAIPEKHLRILDRVMGLVTVGGAIILSVAIIYMTWTILTSSGMDALTKVVSWAFDLLKLARPGV